MKIFENVGDKIKGLAKFLLYFGIIICIIFGSILFVIFAQAEEGGLALISLLMSLCFTVPFIVSSIFLYAFGELVQSSADTYFIAHDTNTLIRLIINEGVSVSAKTEKESE